MNVHITRIQKEDIMELEQHFFAVLSKAYKDNGEDIEEVKGEVAYHLKLANQDLESDGSEVYFLLARTEAQIIGTIACLRANELITNNYDRDFQNIPKVGSVYIHPEYQGKGVGSLLFNAMLITLYHKNVETFCLDGGFKKSQQYWIKKLGQPDVIIQDQWGPGLNHMIWVRDLQDIPVRYQIRSRNKYR